MPSVEDFRGQLDSITLAMIDRLRVTVAASHPALNERIKWNAPSFAVGDDDRVTLGVERKGGVRMVLHRGAGSQMTAGFSFDDFDRLAKWPAPDRGVIIFENLAAIKQSEGQLTSLCRRWFEQVCNSG